MFDQRVVFARQQNLWEHQPAYDSWNMTLEERGYQWHLQRLSSWQLSPEVSHHLLCLGPLQWTILEGMWTAEFSVSSKLLYRLVAAKIVCWCKCLEIVKKSVHISVIETFRWRESSSFGFCQLQHLWCFLGPLSHVLAAHLFPSQLPGIMVPFSLRSWMASFLLCETIM